MSVGDASALAARRPALVADAVVASGAQPKSADTVKGDSSGGVAAGAVLAIAPAQVVATDDNNTPAPSQPTEAAPEPAAQPIGQPAPEPPATPPAVPVLAGGGEGSSGDPITAGVEPEPICEGDEYTITATFLAEGEGDKGPRLEIVLQRRESDGSSEELRLEGDLADVQSLVVKLSGEGGCVTVQIQSSENGETASEATEAVESGNPRELPPR